MRGKEKKKVQKETGFLCCKKKNEPYMVKKVPDGIKK